MRLGAQARRSMRAHGRCQHPLKRTQLPVPDEARSEGLQRGNSDVSEGMDPAKLHDVLLYVEYYLS
jgi:hypothetical protein